jgi:hypothetical protein
MNDPRHARSTALQTCSSARASSNISCRLPSRPKARTRFLLSRADESGLYRDRGPYRTICRRKILELGIPFKELGIEVGTELRLTLTVSEHGMEIARYPHHSPATFNRPGDDFEATMWRV